MPALASRMSQRLTFAVLLLLAQASTAAEPIVARFDEAMRPDKWAVNFGHWEPKDGAPALFHLTTLKDLKITRSALGSNDSAVAELKKRLPLTTIQTEYIEPE